MTPLIMLLSLAAPSSLPSATDPAPLHPAYVPAPALLADGPEMEYTYVEANYLWTDSDDLDESVGGWEFTGSLELPLNFFAQASFSRQSDDADLDTYRIGAGYHLPLGSKLDAFGILSLAHVEIDGTTDDFDDEGIAAELGLRALLSPKLEVNGSAEWVDVDDDNFGLGIGARYYFMDSLSVGGRVEKLDEDESFSAGVRFEF